LVVSPAIGAQVRPFALQRSHWYASDVGAVLHLPVSTWTLPPGAADPETIGWPIERSADGAPLIGPIRLA
jgi:hypothetical protein